VRLDVLDPALGPMLCFSKYFRKKLDEKIGVSLLKMQLVKLAKIGSKHWFFKT
jgi:hypothetical protein